MKMSATKSLFAMSVLVGLSYPAQAELLQFDATGVLDGALGSIIDGTAMQITGVVDIDVANANIDNITATQVGFDSTALQSMTVIVGTETITFNGAGYENVGIIQLDNTGSGSIQTERVQFDVIAAPRTTGGLDLVWDGTLGGSTITEVSFDLVVLNAIYGSFVMDTLYDDREDLFSSVGPGSMPTLGVDPTTGVGRQGEPISFGRFTGGASGSVVGSSGDPILTNFILDDVVFSVPEPGSLALLGLGAIGLLRRRR